METVQNFTLAWTRDPNKVRRLTISAMALLFLVACSSAALAIFRGVSIKGGSDLQWMGSWLVWHHIDPWREALAGYPHLYGHFSQPNYPHQTYLLLWPLSLLNWRAAEVTCCLMNVGLTALCTQLLRRIYGLHHLQSLILL